MLKRLIYLLMLIFFLLSLLIGCDASSAKQGIRNYEASTELASLDKSRDMESNDEDHTSPQHGMTVEEKLEDFEFLFNTLYSNYPYFQVNKRQHAVDWIAQKEDYIKQIKDTDGDLEFYIALDRIMKDLNHDHTRVLNNSSYAYALNIYKSTMLEPWLEILEDPVVEGRYWNVEKDKDNEVDAYVHSGNIILEKWSESSTAYIKIKSFNHFNIEGDLEIMQPFLNDIDDCHSLIIDIRGNGGGDTSYWIRNLIPELISEVKAFSQYFCFRGGAYSEPFIDFAIGYKYSEMEVIDEAFIKSLSSDTPKEIKTDFNYYVKNTLIIEPMDDEGYQGDIYLLVDSSVSSSAKRFVQFMRDNALAYIIGEPTSGKSSGFDSLLLRLPNSGYVIQFPGVMSLSLSGVCTEEGAFMPDLLVESKMALEKAKELIRINNE